MAIYLNSEKQLRFNQLLALFSSGDIGDEQEKELITLRRELQKNKAARIGLLSGIKTQIAELGIAVAELYSKDEISAAAQESGLFISRATQSKSKEKSSRTSDNNEVLMVLRNEPGEKGPTKWSYRQGRIYERASGTTSQPWAMRAKQFPGKLLKLGTSAEALRPYFTPAGTAYFATEAGQAELVRLVEVTLEARKVLMMG